MFELSLCFSPSLQSLLVTFNMRDIYSDYTNDPQNADIIQNSLVARLGLSPSLINLDVKDPSLSFFGVNMTNSALSSLTIEVCL